MPALHAAQHTRTAFCAATFLVWHVLQINTFYKTRPATHVQQSFQTVSPVIPPYACHVWE